MNAISYTSLTKVRHKLPYVFNVYPTTITYRFGNTYTSFKACDYRNMDHAVQAAIDSYRNELSVDHLPGRTRPIRYKEHVSYKGDIVKEWVVYPKRHRGEYLKPISYLITNDNQDEIKQEALAIDLRYREAYLQDLLDALPTIITNEPVKTIYGPRTSIYVSSKGTEVILPAPIRFTDTRVTVFLGKPVKTYHFKDYKNNDQAMKEAIKYYRKQVKDLVFSATCSNKHYKLPCNSKVKGIKFYSSGPTPFFSYFIRDYTTLKERVKRVYLDTDNTPYEERYTNALKKAKHLAHQERLKYRDYLLAQTTIHF